MDKYIQYQLMPYTRSMYIASHRFYREQAWKRMLSNFDDIGKEADAAADRWQKENSANFDPDRDDEGSFMERAHDVSVEFYVQLTELHEQTRLGFVAGMYQQWDKQLREWLTDEIKRWHRDDKLVKEIWKADFTRLVEFFTYLGWPINGTDFHRALNKCRLVVNVHKHGDGGSFQELKNNHPEFLRNLFSDKVDSFLGTDYFDHKNVMVSDQHIDEFANAIEKFWEAIPQDTAEPAGTPPAWVTRHSNRHVNKPPPTGPSAPAFAG